LRGASTMARQRLTHCLKKESDSSRDNYSSPALPAGAFFLFGEAALEIQEPNLC
jgi:hypothetical protein